MFGYAVQMVSLTELLNGDSGFGFIYWQPGSSVVRITWLDGLGAEHERVVTDETSAVDLLLAVGRDPRARILGVVVS